ncbi:hypothetical protein MNBD_GAMMA08-40 [hydrothermal vent metagenome]|uniref:Uncharacterized protein n=1 Tax=hydrothermal vent metagenome TaxID=652676 RepID=A0A3B0Y9C0_9ZZZZ
MKFNKKSFVFKKQLGAALITSLVFMSILTVLGISAMRNNTLDVKIHNAMLDRLNAFQCSEAALRQGERFIKDATEQLDATAGGVPDQGARQVWSENNNILNNLVNENREWWTINGWGDFVLSNPDVNIGCATEAEYIVQSLGGAGDNGSGDLSFKAEAESQMNVYRISSRSEGVSSNSAVILQSTFTRQFQ